MEVQEKLERTLDDLLMFFYFQSYQRSSKYEIRHQKWYTYVEALAKMARFVRLPGLHVGRQIMKSKITY